ncbi:hypothetical protein GF377_05230 [candidate division GN15 bacterium]|nr:hypothetical protein [candidate division GN15 bacterium]
MVAVSAGMLSYGAAVIYQVYKSQALEHDYVVFAIGVVLAVAGLLGCVAVPRQRSMVTDTFVEKRRLFVRRIPFDDVKWAQLYLGELIISDGKRTVTINRVAENGRQLFSAAVEQLQKRPGIEYRGDADALALHFGIPKEN